MLLHTYIYYNTGTLQGDIHIYTLLYITAHYNADTFYYTTVTLHLLIHYITLQDVLIHATIYADTLFPQVDYIQIHFITPQGALILQSLYIFLQIHFITGRLNTCNNIHRYNLHVQYRYIISTGRLYTDTFYYTTGRLNTYVTLHFTYTY